MVESREFGSGNYLSNLVDYVHLNPIRAAILDGTTPEPNRLPMEQSEQRLCCLAPKATVLAQD
jgi:hypothetical protein